jgi:hypothetical protein
MVQTAPEDRTPFSHFRRDGAASGRAIVAFGVIITAHTASGDYTPFSHFRSGRPDSAR